VKSYFLRSIGNIRKITNAIIIPIATPKKKLERGEIIAIVGIIIAVILAFVFG
jgi:hypothetical protein